MAEVLKVSSMLLVPSLRRSLKFHFATSKLLEGQVPVGMLQGLVPKQDSVVLGDLLQPLDDKSNHVVKVPKRKEIC